MGATAKAYEVDVKSKSDLKKAISKTVRDFGGIDIQIDGGFTSTLAIFDLPE